MGWKRTVRSFVGIALVGLAIMALPAAHAPAAQAEVQSERSRFTAQDIDAGRALIAHVPAAFRVTCVLEALDKVPRPAGLVADVQCKPVTGGLDWAVEYLQFGSRADMQADYASFHSGPSTIPARAGCAPDAPYSVGGQATGRSECFDNQTEIGIVYTYEPLLVVGTIEQFADDPTGVDIAALNDFSNHSAGPESTPGKLPSLLSDAEANRAAAALRSHLPAAIAKHCTTGFVAPNPWLAASLTCKKPSPGVFYASYDAYRDDEAFAQFDPKALAARSERTNQVCPTTGTWSANGRKQGRYACWVDNTPTTYLEWSLDSQRILAYAYAQPDGLTGPQLLHWWDTKGALEP